MKILELIAQAKPIEKQAGIYGIFCLANNKIYIGSSKNIKQRIYQHRYYLNNNKHKNSYLQAAFNKYGIVLFQFFALEILEDFSKLLERETYYFNLINRQELFNLEIPERHTISAEARIKIGLAHKGKVISEAHKQKLREFNLGKKLSIETKELMSTRKHTEETKKKIANHNKYGKSPRCKISIEQVKQIKQLLIEEKRICDIVRILNIPRTIIDDIKRNRTWAYIVV